MLDALQNVIELKKVKADGLKVRQDNRAPIVAIFLFFLNLFVLLT